jgi:uncharacterized membrane protein
MNPAVIVVIIAQICFTLSDLLGRWFMPTYGFTIQAFLQPWFAGYLFLRTVATFGQLYVFTAVELGKTMALFGATSIVLANALGLLLLNEVLTIGEYIGVVIAVIAFLVLAFS